MLVKQTEKINKRVYAAILATGLMSFSGVIVETAMNITFPTLMREFDIATNTVQWMTSIYLLIVAIIVPLSAVLKQSFTTKSLFLCANLLFIIGALIDALAGNFAFLLMGRAIQGIGTGIALPLMFNIILEQVPQSRIGFMMGLANMITGIAPAIGPTFVGLSSAVWAGAGSFTFCCRCCWSHWGWESGVFSKNQRFSVKKLMASVLLALP